MVSLVPTQQSTKSQQRTRPLNAKGEPLKPERTNSGGSGDKAEKKSEGGAAANAAKAAAKAASANGSGSGRGSARTGGGASSGRTKRTKMTFEEATQNVTKALGVAGSHTSMIQVRGPHSSGARCSIGCYHQRMHVKQEVLAAGPGHEHCGWEERGARL
jgi:hypothetical protein